jgi:CofD-related protein of GAK system
MLQQVELVKFTSIPENLKIERCRRAPDLGPRILFFSGGTALKGLSQKLINYTHNSIHLITPFDSGGSSAAIRNAFKMIAVGDLRNRLMALADQSVKGNPDIYRLFSYRLPHEENRILINIIYEIIQGKHELIQPVREPMRQIISNHLRYFLNRMPIDFDLKGANIGNMILTGGYLNNHNDIEPVLYIFRKLVESLGIVKPVSDEFLHIKTELEDGTLLVGQHLISGKEAPEITSPIKNVSLIENKKNPHPVKITISEDNSKLIRKADIICYPMGSFYSSLIVNLLPDGVENAIKLNRNPKVYVPNTTRDPEQLGMDLESSIETLYHYLKKENRDLDLKDVLNFIIIDSKNGKYPYPMDYEKIKNRGITIIDTPLITESSRPFIDPELLIHILISLT